MTIDRTDPRSPSRQIADDLRAAITSGSVGPGDKLPSEADLVRQYGVAAQTARQAVSLLKTEGLVEGQAGRGVFVRMQPPLIRVGSDRYARRWRDKGKAPMQAEMEEKGLDWRQEILELATVPAPEWVADWFAIEVETPVFVRRRRTWVEATPTQLADSYYLLEDVNGTKIQEEDTGPGGGFARLEEKGLKLQRFREELLSRMPTPEESRGLQLGQGVPVVELHRISYADGRPVEVFRSIMVSSGHVFAYDFEAGD